MEIWDDYRLILALHRAKTIRGAAEEMGVNHATISRRLARVESHALKPIFERVTGGYRATRFGSEIISAAERMEALTREATRKSQSTLGGLSGAIKLSIPEPIAHYILADALHDFVAAHPDIDLEITTSINLVDLDKSEADIVVRGSDEPPEHLVGRRLFRFSLCQYAHRDYLANTSAERRQWYSFSRSLNPKSWVANSPFPNAKIGLRANDLMWLIGAAKAGRAMINTACYMGDSEPDLVRLPGAKVVKSSHLWVLTHPDLKQAPRIKALMGVITAAMLEQRDLVEGNRPQNRIN